MLHVGLDTSPLALTKAGTARYLTKLLEGLEQEPDLELHRYTWGGTGRVTKVARDLFWYPRRLAEGGPERRRRRPPLSDDARAAAPEAPRSS